MFSVLLFSVLLFSVLLFSSLGVPVLWRLSARVLVEFPYSEAPSGDHRRRVDAYAQPSAQLSITQDNYSLVGSFPMLIA